MGKLHNSFCKILVSIRNENAFNSDNGLHFLICSDYCSKSTKNIGREHFILSSVNVREKQQ